MNEENNEEEQLSNFGYTNCVIILTIISILGCISNGSSIIILIKNSQLLTPQNIIMFNLTVANFAISILGHPLTLTAAIFKGWIFSETVCVMHGFFTGLLGIASMTTLAVLAYDRYLMTCYPQTKSKLTKVTALYAIAGIWLYAFAVTGPPLFGWNRYVQEPANIRRADATPTKNNRLCSCHFKNGQRINGPTFFKWNESQLFAYTSPEKRQRTKKQTLSSENGTVELPIESDLECPPKSNNDILESNIEKVLTTSDNYFLQQENESLKKELLFLKQQPFGYHSICSNESMILFYTGISKEMFDLVVESCTIANIEYFCSWRVKSFSLNDQVLMTFMKLRLNILYKDIAFRFNTTKTTVSNIVVTFIFVLHEILFLNLMDKVPSQIKNRMCLPHCFENFKNCKITIDCTEIPCDIPKKLDQQKMTYSSYKHKNTLKGLIGVAPNGVITFVSKLYPGSTSDKKIVSHCGVLSSCVPGDLVLADKGFVIADLLPSGVSLNIPLFLTLPQFTPSEVEKTKSIARARIHVERAIRRVKGYKILNHIPKSLFTKSSTIFQLCASIVNLQNPLIKEVEEMYTNNANE